MMWMDLIERDDMIGNVLSEEEIKKLYKGRWVVVLKNLDLNRVIATSLNEDVINDMKDMYIEANKSLQLGEVCVKYID